MAHQRARSKSSFPDLPNERDRPWKKCGPSRPSMDDVQENVIGNV